jgi:hypothetical protein
VEKLNDAVTWDGAEWKETPKTALAYMVAKLAKEFGWRLGDILDMTISEVGAILEQMPRVNYESAMYTAIAFNDPKRITSALEEIQDSALSPRERWLKGVAKMRGG